MSFPKTVIIIGGATASGKTSLAVRVAKHFKTEIISADSRQCYKELNIGVAKPASAQLQEVPHWFISSHSIHEKQTAASFEQYALQKTNELFSKNDVVVMVGGTGLYLRAFTEGLHEIPAVPEETVNDITEQYFQFGLNWLQQEIRSLDPLYFEKGEVKNPQRLMRALAVIRTTGKSILEYHNDAKTERPFRVLKFAIDLSMDKLKSNIERRTDQMIADGLVEEAKELWPHHHVNALQTVGYKEMFSYFREELSLPEAVAAIKLHTRQYAKRQVTWFKNDGGYESISPEGILQNSDTDIVAAV